MSTLKEAFAEYADANYFGPKKGACTVAWVYADGNVKFMENNGCHAIIGSIPMERTAIYSSLRCRYEELYEAALDYWDLIMSKDGPWRQAMKDVDVLKDDSGRPVAFGYKDLDISTQIGASAFIQARVPHEHSNKLRAYWAFRQAGFDPLKSMFLSEHILLNAEGKFMYNQETYKHAFNTSQYGISVKALVNGDPVVSISRFNSSNSYTPVTEPWKGKLLDFGKIVAIETAYNGVFPVLRKTLHGTLDSDKSPISDKATFIQRLKDTESIWWDVTR